MTLISSKAEPVPRSLTSERIREEHKRIVEAVEADKDTQLIPASLSTDKQIHLQNYSLIDAFELGRSLGASEVYAVLEETDDGTAEWARVSFLHQDYAHTQYVESEELTQIRENETEERIDEFERKENLAEEILEQYDGLLSEAQRYRLRHNIEDMRMDRLFQLQDRLQDEKEQKIRESRIDEGLEQELSEVLYQNERFDHQFNQMDTEMLLKQLDITFDDESVRVEEVHRRAKSLLKVNEDT